MKIFPFKSKEEINEYFKKNKISLHDERYSLLSVRGGLIIKKKYLDKVRLIGRENTTICFYESNEKILNLLRLGS